MIRFSRLIMLILLTTSSVGLCAQADSLDFPAPQYMLPMYDHYSINHLNADAMGRGFTNTAVMGKVDHAVNNPASLGREKAFLYMEVSIKPPISELNKQAGMMYSSPLPLGLLGANFRLYKGLFGAISYNVPKSIVYDDFTVEIGQGADSVVRYPSYYLHQLTTTLAGDVGNFSLGLNIHHQLHSFQDIQVFQTFDRVDKTFYVFRIQPGMLYRWESFNFGATLTPQASTDMNVKYEEYKVTLPTIVNAGLSWQFSNNLLLAEAEWEQFSSMDSHFNDRITLKAGFEKTVRKVTYRCGLMSLPGVFSGDYRLPVHQTSNPEEVLWWQDVPRGGHIGKTDQLYATGGFTYNFKGGKLSMGLMRDVLGNVETTQLSMAMGFNLDTLKGRKFLIFDK